MNEIGHCIVCIGVTMDNNNAFLDNDDESFLSDVCPGCGSGLVPNYIPTNQVIRYIKKIFNLNNVVIERKVIERKLTDFHG
jgi:hypothetical protein